MKLLLNILASSLLALSAVAADKAVPEGKLADFKLGKLLTGPAVDLGNTGGKAVVIESWGVNCARCLAGLPDMEKLAKRNRTDTIVIGAHVQEATDTEVKAVVKKNRLSYTIVNGVTTPSKLDYTGLPHAFVFDTTGKLVFTGSPEDKDFDTAVRRAGRATAPR